MKVYFNGNFWGHQKNERAGTQISLDKEFKWGDQSLKIPAIYSCAQGLVMDICIQVPREKVETFLEKWGDEEGLTEYTVEEQVQIDRENPLFLRFHAELKINGKPAASKSMCAVSWFPCETAKKYRGLESEELMEAYQCDRNSGWQFVRAYFKWPDNKEPRIHSLSLNLKADPVSYAGPHFIIGDGCCEKELAITHPVTKKVYLIQIVKCEKQDVSGAWGNEKDIEYPDHLLLLTYSVAPELSLKEFQIRDCAEGAQPRRKELAGESGGPDSKRAAAIGLIGGVVGCTAIRMRDEKDEKESPKLFTAYSALHFEPVDSAEWRIEFYQKEQEDLLVEIQLQDKD